MIQSLPPLSLSNDYHLTPLGVKSLEKVSKFLKEVVLQTSGTEIHGKLASELLLGIALQRGSLRYILEWIQMALDSSCLKFRQGKISKSMLEKALTQMRGEILSPTKIINNKSSFGDEIDLYEAAMLVMEELVKMAVDHEGISLIFVIY